MTSVPMRAIPLPPNTETEVLVRPLPHGRGSVHRGLHRTARVSKRIPQAIWTLLALASGSAADLEHGVDALLKANPAGGFVGIRVMEVPTGKKVKLLIENRDSTPEEFESHSLNREKVIPGKSTGTVYIGPLAAGSYPFVGEFNEKTAKGVIVAK